MGTRAFEPSRKNTMRGCAVTSSSVTPWGEKPSLVDERPHVLQQGGTVGQLRELHVREPFEGIGQGKRLVEEGEVPCEPGQARGELSGIAFTSSEAPHPRESQEGAVLLVWSARGRQAIMVAVAREDDADAAIGLALAEPVVPRLPKAKKEAMEGVPNAPGISTESLAALPVAFAPGHACSRGYVTLRWAHSHRRPLDGQ